MTGCHMVYCIRYTITEAEDAESVSINCCAKGKAMEEQGDNYMVGSAFDCRGYLVDPSSWTHELRDRLAREENITLNEEHHQVIHYIRNYYQENSVHPLIRMITADMAEIFGAGKGTIKYFHSLFPAGINQAFRIAGLPVKHSCC